MTTNNSEAVVKVGFKGSNRNSTWQKASVSFVLIAATGTAVLATIFPLSAVAQPAKQVHSLVLAQAQNAESFYRQGLAKLEKKDYKGALADFTKAIRLKPDYAQAYWGRGRAKYFLDDNRGAITDFDEAIRLKPNYAEAYWGRGRAKYFWYSIFVKDVEK